MKKTPKKTYDNDAFTAKLGKGIFKVFSKPLQGGYTLTDVVDYTVGEIKDGDINSVVSADTIFSNKLTRYAIGLLVPIVLLLIFWFIYLIWWCCWSCTQCCLCCCCTSREPICCCCCCYGENGPSFCFKVYTKISFLILAIACLFFCIIGAIGSFQLADTVNSLQNVTAEPSEFLGKTRDEISEIETVISKVKVFVDTTVEMIKNVTGIDNVMDFIKEADNNVTSINASIDVVEGDIDGLTSINNDMKGNLDSLKTLIDTLKEEFEAYGTIEYTVQTDDGPKKITGSGCLGKDENGDYTVKICSKPYIQLVLVTENDKDDDKNNDIEHLYCRRTNINSVFNGSGTMFMDSENLKSYVEFNDSMSTFTDNLNNKGNHILTTYDQSKKKVDNLMTEVGTQVTALRGNIDRLTQFLVKMDNLNFNNIFDDIEEMVNSFQGKIPDVSGVIQPYLDKISYIYKFYNLSIEKYYCCTEENGNRVPSAEEGDTSVGEDKELEYWSNIHCDRALNQVKKLKIEELLPEGSAADLGYLNEFTTVQSSWKNYTHPFLEAEQSVLKIVIDNLDTLFGNIKNKVNLENIRQTINNIDISSFTDQFSTITDAIDKVSNMSNKLDKLNVSKITSYIDSAENALYGVDKTVNFAVCNENEEEPEKPEEPEQPEQPASHKSSFVSIHSNQDPGEGNPEEEHNESGSDNNSPKIGKCDFYFSVPEFVPQVIDIVTYVLGGLFILFGVFLILETLCGVLCSKTGCYCCCQCFDFGFVLLFGLVLIILSLIGAVLIIFSTTAYSDELVVILVGNENDTDVEDKYEYLPVLSEYLDFDAIELSKFIGDALDQEGNIYDILNGMDGIQHLKNLKFERNDIYNVVRFFFNYDDETAQDKEKNPINKILDMVITPVNEIINELSNIKQIVEDLNIGFHIQDGLQAYITYYFLNKDRADINENLKELNTSCSLNLPEWPVNETFQGYIDNALGFLSDTVAIDIERIFLSLIDVVLIDFGRPFIALFGVTLVLLILIFWLIIFSGCARTFWPPLEDDDDEDEEDYDGDDFDKDDDDDDDDDEKHHHHHHHHGHKHHHDDDKKSKNVEMEDEDEDGGRKEDGGNNDERDGNNSHESVSYVASPDDKDDGVNNDEY